MVASPVVVAANATVIFTGIGVHKFLPVTSGFITISKLYSGPVAANDGTYIPILNTFPVSAGIFVQLDFHVGHLGGQIVATGGASGVLTVC